MQRFSAVPAAALEDRDITDSEYRTLAAIALYADKDGWCYPSQSTIAELRDVTRQTIITHIKKLKKKGYLNVKHRKREDGGMSSNLYQVRLDYPLSNPDFTGGVKSKTLQGVSNPDFTPPVKPRLDTNTPFNTPELNTPSEKALAIKSIIDFWCNAVGRWPYNDTDGVQFYGEPAEQLLIRLEWDTGKAIELLKRARGQMLKDGKTPYKLSGVVPFAFALLDGFNQNGQHKKAEKGIPSQGLKEIRPGVY